MKKKSYHLVTSPNEKTWDFNKQLIFISNYCIPYSKKNILKKIKYKILNQYFISNNSKAEHEKNARKLEEVILEKLYLFLNDFHSTNYSKRFWRILLGHWLRRYTNLIYNRVKTLENAFSLYNISSYTSYNEKNYSLSTNNTRDLIFASDDPVWNNIIYSKLIKINENIKINFKNIENPNFSFQIKNTQISFKKKLFFFVYDIYSYLTNLFIKNNSPVIINPYIPYKFEFSLFLSLKKFPKIYRTKNFITKKEPNFLLRSKLADKFYSKKNDWIEDALHKLIFELLPVHFLEAFNDLVTDVKKLYWPSNPKFIFTSNNFDTDELFKCYTALSVEKGSKYFVGQHGSTYGTHRFEYLTIEEITCDRFFTWGWSEDTKHYKGFSFFNLRKKINYNNNSNKIVLISQNLGTNVEYYDLTYEFEIYWKNQFHFIEHLDKFLKKNILIRLFNTTYWEEKKRWIDFDKTINLNCKTDKEHIPIEKILKNSKLCIVTFDTTTIYELLINDIPFVAYWDKPLEQIRNSALPYYDKLINAKILFHNPIDAAKHVNTVWGNINLWWYSKNVIKAKKAFKSRYISTSNSPINDLKIFLSKNNN